jgi:hypothetical protein
MTSTKSPNILFHEEQASGKSGLLTALLLGAVVLTVVRFALWFNVSQSDSQNSGYLLFAFVVAVIAALALLIPVFCARLTTEVNRSGLYIQFFPFHLSPKKIPLNKVVQLEIKTYRPVRDYLGYGIRYGAAGKAYNMSGDRGVNLKFSAGRDILIGSQKPEELAQALQQLLPHCSVRTVQ